MTDTYQLKTKAILKRLIGELKELEISEEDPFQIMITRGKDLRSKAQNKLYWKHMAEWARQTGHDIEDYFEGETWVAGLHYITKRKHLHPIYMAGNSKKNINYQLNYQTILDIKKDSGNTLNFQMLHSSILSTTDASVKQFGDYIDLYVKEATASQFYLTDPNAFYETN